eukprot:gene2263-2595_t
MSQQEIGQGYLSENEERIEAQQVLEMSAIRAFGTQSPWDVQRCDVNQRDIDPEKEIVSEVRAVTNERIRSQSRSVQSVDSEIRFRSPVPPRERTPESGFGSPVPLTERRPESGLRAPVPLREPRSEVTDAGRDALIGTTRMMARAYQQSPYPQAPLWRPMIDEQAMTCMPLAPGPYSLQRSGAPSTVQWPWATNVASSGMVHCGRMTPQPPLKPTWYTQPGVYISSTAHQGQQPAAPASIVHKQGDMPRFSTNMATRPSNMPTLSRLGATMEQSSHLSEAEDDREMAKCLLQRIIASIDWQEEDIERLQQKQEALKRANARLEEATKELERQHKNTGLSVAERMQRLEVFDEDSSIATTAMRRINNMLNRGEKHAEKSLYYEIEELDLIAKEFKYHKFRYKEFIRKKKVCQETAMTDDRAKGDYEAVIKCLNECVLGQNQAVSTSILHEIYGLNPTETRHRSRLKGKILSDFKNKLYFLIMDKNTPEVVINREAIEARTLLNNSAHIVEQAAKSIPELSWPIELDELNSVERQPPENLTWFLQCLLKDKEHPN